MDNLMTASQAARILGISAERIRQLANAGTLVCTPTPLGRLFAASDVERLRIARQPEAGTEPETVR